MTIRILRWVAIVPGAFFVPSRKRVVAWLTVAAGSSVATALAVAARTTIEAVVAIVAGLAAAYVSGRFGESERQSVGA